MRPSAIPLSQHSEPTTMTPSSYSDLIADLARNNDQQTFITLFNHFAPRVKSFLMRNQMPEDEAEELAQETMLTVWQKAAQFDPAIANASTWVFTIARNKKIDRQRKHRVVTLDIDDMVAAGNEPAIAADEYTIDETRMRDRLDQAIRQLPSDQAALVQKAFYDDLSHSEIAAQTNLPLGTVKSRLRMGLAKLRAQLFEMDK